MNYIITGKNYTSPLIKSFAGQNGYKVLTEEELIKSDITFTDQDKIYCPDETTVPHLQPRMIPQRWHKLETVKNKFRCREILRPLYPDFYFREVSINELENITLPQGKKFIIKPQKGFFGVGIREIDANSDLKKLAEEIRQEIAANIQTFSPEVFTASDFIIEEFVQGEEYSFDLYYNDQGQPVFTNMCHHPQAKDPAYFHVLYYTSAQIYERFYQQVHEIFTEFNRNLGLQNMPVHAEFKEQDGRLVPIEFNVPRFGGFGLADLPYYAFGENPFLHFFQGTSPAWPEIFSARKDKYYGWVLCYNGKNIDTSKYKPDYDKVKQDLGKVLFFDTLDYKNNPVFAVAYVELSSQAEIDKILSLDFDKYFVRG